METQKKIYRCKKCKLNFEVKENQSIFFCDYCRPPSKCVHGVSTLEDCDECLLAHESKFVRSMPQTGVYPTLKWRKSR